jgi:hypothetical protein
MYYQRITSLFRGFFSLKQIFCQVTGEDDFNLKCVPQLAIKGVVVTDSPMPVAKIDTACKSNISILKKKSRKCWY